MVVVRARGVTVHRRAGRVDELPERRARRTLLPRELRGADRLREPRVPDGALCEHDQMLTRRIRDPVRRLPRTEGELRAEHRRQPQGARRFCEAHDTVETVVIGEGQRGQPEPRRFLDELLGMARAVEEREVRMAVQFRVHAGSTPLGEERTYTNTCSPAIPKPNRSPRTAYCRELRTASTLWEMRPSLSAVATACAVAAAATLPGPVATNLLTNLRDVAGAASVARTVVRPGVKVCGPQPTTGWTADCHAVVAMAGTDLFRSPTPVGLSPDVIKQVYGWSTKATAGTGRTIAIVDAFDDPSAESDLALFSQTFGLPPCTTANGCFTKVNQTGGIALPKRNNAWSLEISLDMQWAHTIAPGAKILLVEARSAPTRTCSRPSTTRSSTRKTCR